MHETNKRVVGAKAEQLIRDYLSANDYEILEMNYRCKQGEVDIIAKHGKYYVFIEVKYRSSTKYGLPEEAVGIAKQRRISKAALYCLYSHNLPDTTPVRFDVAAILVDTVHYIKDAFSYVC